MKNLDKIISLIKDDDFGMFENILIETFTGLYLEFEKYRKEISCSTEKFPIIEKDKNGNITFLNNGKHHIRKEYDEQGRLTYFQDDEGFWYQKLYLEDGGFQYVDSYGTVETYKSDEIVEKLLESDRKRNERKKNNE